MYDCVFTGLVQPLLGTFSIPIGDILEETRENVKKELEQSDRIIKQLKKLLAGKLTDVVDEEAKFDSQGN